MSKRRAMPMVAVGDLDDIERAQSLKGADGPGPGQSPQTPEAELIAKADAAQLQAAIAALPPQFRETLALRDLPGLDAREIADARCSPVGPLTRRSPLD